MATDIHATDARFAAEASPDVNAEKIGEVYAESLFGVLDNDPVRIGEMLEEFGDFIAEGLTVFPEFEKVLVSRLVSADEKVNILERIFASRVSPLFLNFLRVVANHDRLDCLRAIYARARKRYDTLLGRVDVTVTTATELPADQTRKLADALGGLLKGIPEITHRVDPSVIGGLVVRVGDTIYDGSVAIQLKNICQNVINHYTPDESL